jgi:hypothetical protein
MFLKTRRRRKATEGCWREALPRVYYSGGFAAILLSQKLE